MKKVASIILLALYSILALGQANIENMDKIVISYSGDSTLLTEKYEINLNKKKIYYITPIMNYLDIKGEKYRTRIQINKNTWKEIEYLISKISSFKTEDIDLKSEDNITYSSQIIRGNKVIKGTNYYTEEVPDEIKELFNIIRKQYD